MFLLEVCLQTQVSGLEHCIRKTIPEQVARSRSNTMFVEVNAKCISNIQNVKT